MIPKTDRPMSPATWRGLVLALVVAWGLGARGAEAGDPLVGDVRTKAQALIGRAKDELDAGLEGKDAARIAAARDELKNAKVLLTAELARRDASGLLAAELRHDLVDLDVWLAWAEDASREHRTSKPGPGEAAEPGAAGEGAPIARKDGAQFGPWVRKMRAEYEAQENGVERAILAQRMAAEAGIHALPCLFALWKREEDPKAREGLHDALATIGSSRVPLEMAKYARRDQEERWTQALDVLYRGLEKPEKSEPEKPWCRALREFHELKERKLSLRIQERLDAMGYEGNAALGELLYVEDFGYHDYTVGLLAKRLDGRVVPPLVFKLNRFAFEYMEQMPAHKALLKMGWHAVPELIEHLDDKAAGIWISWTLRKITGETMGTDKRKWHDWWKHASVQHPELFDDPEERPGGAPRTGPTTPSSK